MPQLTANQIAGLAYNAGFRGADLRTATAVALAESGGNPNAYNPEAAAGTRNGSGSRGLWQIYGQAHPEFNTDQIYNPSLNAAAAYRVYLEAGRSFRPWSTYNNGQASTIARSLNVNGVTNTLQGTYSTPSISSVVISPAHNGLPATAASSGTGTGTPPGDISTPLGNIANPLPQINLLPEAVTKFFNSGQVADTIYFTVFGITLIALGALILIVSILGGSGVNYARNQVSDLTSAPEVKVKAAPKGKAEPVFIGGEQVGTSSGGKIQFTSKGA